MQKITSKNTSQNQLAGFYKKALKSGIITKHSVVFDYGCGKYFDNVVDFATENNFVAFGFDKYNKSDKGNDIAISRLRHCTMITCNNVLNVVSGANYVDVIRKLSNYSKRFNIPVYITAYEGNKSGIGSETKRDCYQRNERTGLHVASLQAYFDNVSVKNKIIKCY